MRSRKKYYDNIQGEIRGIWSDRPVVYSSYPLGIGEFLDRTVCNE